MVEMSNANVASVAKKATDDVGLVAMVNMEISPTTRIRSPAAGTLAALPRKLLLVPTQRNAISGSQNMILSGPGVSRPPLPTLLGSLFEVLLSPLFMALDVAYSAIDTKTMPRITTFAKGFSRERFSASWAKLLNRISKGFLCHESVLQLNTRTGQ